MNVRQVSNGALSQLQEWYLNQCDEDWEHTYGIKIDTLDNPGWMLTVDLADTNLSGRTMSRQIIQRSEQDWVQQEVLNGQYLACGGPANLEELIEMFGVFSKSE